MKQIFRTFLAIALVACLSVTAFAGGYEDGGPTIEETVQSWIDAGHPVVSRVSDSSVANYAQLSSDQMGKYVSIFINGHNLNIDTIKPVFYDDAGNVISGEVAAVETVNSGFYTGAFFRIEKLDSDAWNIENTDSMNSKKLTIKLESVCGKEIKYENEPFSDKVEIYRRDVYYTAFDHSIEALTIYFSTDVSADLNVKPKLKLGYREYNSDTGEYVFNVVKEAEANAITKEVNKFTGQEETKAVFPLNGFDYTNAFDVWAPQFIVTFKNSKTESEETYASYDDKISQIVGRVSFFQESYKSTSVKGNRDVILYYPYWIGGIYQFADTGSNSQYYITKDEAKYLGNERFAYAEYAKGQGSLVNGDFKQREYNFSYFISNAPEKITQVPKVNVKIDGDDFILSWKKIDGAAGYRIYIVTDDGYSTRICDTNDLSFTINKNMMNEFSEMGYANSKLKICAYSEKDGNVLEGTLSEAIALEETNNADGAELKVTEKSLKAGEAFTLEVLNAEGQAVSYKSSKKSVAAVDKATGEVTALKKGTAEIVASVGDEMLTCTVTVKSTPQVKNKKKVAKNNTKITVKKGKTLKLTITGKAASINNKVTSSKKKVASITSKPKNAYVTIKGLKKGSSVIKITINNAVTYKYTIKVK